MYEIRSMLFLLLLPRRLEIKKKKKLLRKIRPAGNFHDYWK
jgi:hypothetical protein